MPFNETSTDMPENLVPFNQTFVCLFDLILYVPQGFSLASAIGHSPKIVPDVRDFAVHFGQFVRDDFRKHTLYGYAQ